MFETGNTRVNVKHMNCKRFRNFTDPVEGTGEMKIKTVNNKYR